MDDEFEDRSNEYLDDARGLFEQYKRLAEKALGRLTDEGFFASMADGSNSAAAVVKHISGNQRSRWTNFLTEDGEKPYRDRDSEFEAGSAARDDLMRSWEAGWQILFEALAGLSAEDLSRDVTIRGERLPVVRAINRQLTHYAYHVGQIVFIAKAARGGEWSSLSVPKGRSDDFNEFMTKRAELGTTGRHYLEDAQDFFGDDREDGGE